MIYLLNPEIDGKQIKTMFTNDKNITYSKTRRFEIKGKSKHYGYYSISVIPINNDCGKETMAEINARMHN